MKCVVTALAAFALISAPQVAQSQSESSEDDSVRAFVEGVRVLHPRDESSQTRFETLVRQFVPAKGPIDGFLGFMRASGFTCPWAHSLAPEITRENPAYTCSLDISSTEPSLSSASEIEIFYVTANCDATHEIMSVEAQVFHGITGL